MTLADAFVLWIGAQEVIAGLLYFRQRNYPLALTWLSYGLACTGLALAAQR